MNNLSLAYIREKWQHAGFQRYFQNTGWMFIMRVFSMVVTLVSTLLVARNLGPTNFGQISYATSFVGIFSFIASLGIDSVLYRELIKFPDKRNVLLGTSFKIKLYAGIITAIAVSILASVWTTDDVSRVLIFILSITFVFNSFQIIAYEFQARVESKYVSIIAFLMNFVLCALNVIIVLSGKGVIFLALALVIQSILYAVSYWFIYTKKVKESIYSWKFDKQIALMILKDSWPLIFTSAFIMIYSEIDQIMLKSMIDAHAVGIYDSAVRVVEAWYFIPSIIVSSFFPAMINAKISSREVYIKRMRKLYTFMFVMSLVLALASTVFASLIMHILYGNAFSSGIPILQVYTWSLIGTFIGNLLMNHLIAENQTKVSFVVSFIPMVLNILLNIIFIPKFGVIGPAYATLIAYSSTPFVVLFFKKTRAGAMELIKNP